MNPIRQWSMPAKVFIVLFVVVVVGYLGGCLGRTVVSGNEAVRIAPLESRAQIEALHTGQRLEASQPENGGSHVHQRGERIHATDRGNTRSAHHQGHALRAVPSGDEIEPRWLRPTRLRFKHKDN